MRLPKHDAVYVYLYQGESAPGLRFSLRSLAKNYSRLRDVWIVASELPQWVNRDTVKWLKVTNDKGSKYRDAHSKWQAACMCDHITPDFLAMNDDFYIMKRVNGLINYHGGDYREWMTNPSWGGKYRQHVNNTLRVFNPEALDKGECYSYALHVPMVLDREKWLHMSHLHNMPASQLSPRTVYGNMYNIGGRRMADVKVGSMTELMALGGDSLPFISTGDQLEHDPEWQAWMTARFPDRCKFEVSEWDRLQ